MTAADALVRGRAAFDAQAWWAAYEELTAAANTAPLAAEDLVRLGTAAELTGAGPDMTPGGLPAPGGWPAKFCVEAFRSRLSASAQLGNVLAQPLGARCAKVRRPPRLAWDLVIPVKLC